MHREDFDVWYSAAYAPLGIPADQLITAQMDVRPSGTASLVVQTAETHRERTIVLNHWRNLAWQYYGDTETMNIIDQLDARGY